jgi:hypothetical protein
MAGLAQQAFDWDVPIVFVSELKGIPVQIVIVPDNCCVNAENEYQLLRPSPDTHQPHNR